MNNHIENPNTHNQLVVGLNHLRYYEMNCITLLISCWEGNKIRVSVYPAF